MEWDQVKSFTKAIAQAMAADSPDRYVATITKSKRHGKILIDYLRNGRGATTVAPYSTREGRRARVHAARLGGVSPEIGPAYLTLANTPVRLAQLSKDPWGDFRQAAVPLPSAKRPVATRATAKSRQKKARYFAGQSGK